MKGLLVFVFVLTIFGSCTVKKSSTDLSQDNFNLKYTVIPDTTFEKALIYLGYDDVNDGQVLTANINTIDTLIISDNIILLGQISDLTGIEDFSALTYLNCSWNELKTLDLSKNSALTNLYCGYNRLTTLNISSNTTLTELICFNSSLTSLDVSSNTALTYLNCSNTFIKTLDLSKNSALTNLYCGYNRSLTSLDVSSNTALTYLDCSNTFIKTLDLSKNSALTQLFCFETKFDCFGLKKKYNLK